MNEQEDGQFKWPCGHKNKAGILKCEVCGMELLTVGIDLGTTDSLCAICWEITPEKQPPFRYEFSNHQAGSHITPSVAYLNKNHEFIVGAEAEEYRSLEPENVIFSIKRLMGKRFDDDNVQRLMKRVEYRIVDEGGMAAVELRGKVYTPAQISAEVLKRIKDDAEKHFHKRLTHAVITVPANFDSIQIQATIEAGRRAGFFVKRIVNEPVAATYAYGYGLSKTKSGKILVFDMGGGTFDVSIVRMGEMGTSLDIPLKYKGDMWLGGDDLDQKLVDKKKAEIKEKYGVDPSSEASFMEELRVKIRQAKERLCTSDKQREVPIHFDHLLPCPDGDRMQYIKVEGITLTRDEIAMAAIGLVDRAVKLVRDALNEAILNPADIDKVLLVGGSSYLIGIQRKLRDIFPAEVIEDIQMPIDAVAIGAAILAKRIKGMWCSKGHVNEPTAVRCASVNRDGVICGEELEPFAGEMIPHNYGIETLGGKFEIILPKGTRCLSLEPEKRTFYTSFPGQRKIRIPIYQGDKEMAKDNTWQGVLNIELDESVDINTIVNVSMNINRDRILEVTAECLGKSKSARIIPSDWAWSLREMVDWAEKRQDDDENIVKLFQQGQEIIKKWDSVSAPESKEADEVSQDGKKILTELEQHHWQEQLIFYIDWFSKMIEYKDILDPAIVESIQRALESCRTALINRNARDQVDTQLKSVFEKIFTDRVARTLFIMEIISNSGLTDPDIEKVTNDCKNIKEQLEVGRAKEATLLVVQLERMLYFKKALDAIFGKIEMPNLVKSEMGYGENVDTGPVRNK